VGNVTLKNNKEKAPNAPGMLEKHYAPQTKTYLVENIASFIAQHPDQKIGLLLHMKELKEHEVAKTIYLTKTGDLKEAASKLYSAMHELDKLDLDLIVAQRFPDIELGKSINDRLERATK
jgi:L-threonylcarbamoyladenylate synthase